MLTFGKKAKGAQSLSYDIPKKTTEIEREIFEYELNMPNNARPCFEIGLAPNGEKLDDVKCWIPCGRDGRHGLDFSKEECADFWARAEFNVEALPKKLCLVVDSDEFHTVFLNGRKITASEPFFLWSHENRIFDITKALKKGVNKLAVHVKTSEFASKRISFFHTNETLDPIVLHGDFAVKYNDRETTLCALPNFLTVGDLCEQGLKNYLGDVTLKMPLPKGFAAKAIYLPSISGAGATSVAIDGKPLGTRLWGPYVFDAQGIRGKTLSITLSGNLGLLLKRRYGCQRFIDSPFGLMKTARFF